jgi:hypothetical protein
MRADEYDLKSTYLVHLILVLILIFLPYLWHGEGVKLIVQDNLDSNVSWYTSLKQQGKIYAPPWTKVDGMVISTPRFSYPSGLNIELSLYSIFSPFVAFALNKALIVIFAFFSMRFLLHTLEGRNGPNSQQIIWWSLVWMSLAFYPHRGVSIAGLPMVFALIHQIRLGEFRGRHIFLIVIYAFYSMFLLAVMYIWLVFAFWVIFWMIRDRKLHGRLWFFMFFWVLLYAIQDYHYIYYYFFQNDFVSHRSEMNYSKGLWNELNIWSLVKMGDHLGALYPHFMIFLLFGMLIAHFKKKRISPYVLTFVFTFLSLVILVWAVSNLVGMDWIGRQIPVLKSINLMRFNHIFPFLIMGILGVIFTRMRLHYVKIMSITIIAVNILVYHYEWRYWLGNQTGFIEFRAPSYQEYYAKEQYDEIKEFIGKDYPFKLIGHINLPPAVSIYHGFRSVDGYLQNYDVAHKHKVGEVIENEIKRDEFLYSHFFDWGNKCYLLNTTYPDNYTAYKWQKFEAIEKLEFDFIKLKNDLGVSLIFSAIPVDVTQLQMLRKFEHSNSAWDIYVYEIDT